MPSAPYPKVNRFLLCAGFEAAFGSAPPAASPARYDCASLARAFIWSEDLAGRYGDCVGASDLPVNQLDRLVLDLGNDGLITIIGTDGEQRYATLPTGASVIGPYGTEAADAAKPSTVTSKLHMLQLWSRQSRSQRLLIS